MSSMFADSNTSIKYVIYAIVFHDLVSEQLKTEFISFDLLGSNYRRFARGR